MTSNYELTKNWLISSGIFVSESTHNDFGGVHSYYDESKKAFAFLYPEITGYYSSTMRFLFEHEKNSAFIEYSKASCNWLIKLFEKYGGIIQGIDQDGTPKKFVYSFDSGICAKGLVDCYLISKEEKFLEMAKKLNQWIIDETICENGLIKPVKNLSTNQFEVDKKIWYKQSGCLHIKLIIPLVEQYRISKDSDLLEKIKIIADSISHFQNSDGSIMLHLDNKTINLHTLCYALEGLIYAYMATNEENYLKSCKKAIAWAEKHIQKDGSIELWFNSKYHSKSSYPIAQIIRLKILIAKIDDQKLDQNISKLKLFLLSLQCNSENSETNGGFYEEFNKSIFGWKKTLKVNSWASMFSLQALYWIDNFSELDIENEFSLLY